MKCLFTTTTLLVTLSCLITSDIEGKTNVRSYAKRRDIHVSLAALKKALDGMGKNAVQKQTPALVVQVVQVQKPIENPTTQSQPTPTEVKIQEKTTSNSTEKNPTVPVKTMEQIVAETTNPADKENFGIGKLVKMLREEAAKEHNPHRHIFIAALPVGEEFLAFNGTFFEAVPLYRRLHEEAKAAIEAEMNKRNLSIFGKKAILTQFLAANSIE